MKKTPWWSWNVSEEELREQIEKYNEIKFTHSYRGQVIVFFSIVFLMSLAISLLAPNILSVPAVLGGFAIYAVLIGLGYFGYRWALIALLVYWTVDKTITITMTLQYASGSLVASLIFLVIGIVLIVRSIKVETQRKKLKQNSQVVS